MDTGVNWSYRSGMFSFFGRNGYKDGDRWIVPAELVPGKPVLLPSKPELFSPQIVQLIESDIADGNGDKIAYVGVAPCQAVLLALEGIITVEQLRGAEESPARIMIDVVLGGTERKLAILADANYTAATYDENDELV